MFRYKTSFLLSDKLRCPNFETSAEKLRINIYFDFNISWKVKNVLLLILILIGNNRQKGESSVPFSIFLKQRGLDRLKPPVLKRSASRRSASSSG